MKSSLTWLLCVCVCVSICLVCLTVCHLCACPCLARWNIILRINLSDTASCIFTHTEGSVCTCAPSQTLAHPVNPQKQASAPQDSQEFGQAGRQAGSGCYWAAAAAANLSPFSQQWSEKSFQKKARQAEGRALEAPLAHFKSEVHLE